MQTLQKENKMGVMPVGKLLATMALPMIVSMLVQALYNIVDSIYVSRVSEDALTAVSMAFPVQNLIIGFSTGIGVGVNSLLSKSLGSRDFDRANRAASNGLILAAICSLAFMVLGGLFSGLFFQMQSDIPAIVDGGTEYLSICTVFSFGIFGEILFERLLQATGRTMYTMITQGIGAILNIMLDPLFIFGGLGIAPMGVAGAAVATVIGQIVAFVLAVILHFTKNKDVKLSFAAIKLKWHVLKPILGVGVPSVLMVAIGSLMTLCMNGILYNFTPTAVSVFGAYFKLQSFIFMPLFGLNNALISIVAYNYGARRPERIRRVIALAMCVAFGLMMIGFLSFQFCPELLLSMFEPTEQFMKIGCDALRAIGWHYLAAGFCIVLNAVFQALGKGLYSTFNSMARQLVVLLPAAYLLSLTGRLELVWWSFPIAEVMSLTVSALLFTHLYRKLLRPMFRENQ